MELPARTIIDDMVKNMKESFLVMLNRFLLKVAVSHEQIQQWLWILYVLEGRETVDSVEAVLIIENSLSNMNDYMIALARQQLGLNELTEISLEIDDSILEFCLDNVLIEEDSNNNEQVDVLFYEDEILEE